MTYTAAAEHSFSALPTARATAGLQRAFVWLLGASGAIVFIEPSPYEFVTLLAMLVFFATGMRARLVFVPLALLLFLINIGYSIGAAPLLDRSEIVSWVLTSWYMAATVLLFAMIVSDDTV